MGSWLDRVIAWSIHERAVVLLGAVALLVVGLWSASRASLDVMPDFTPPRVSVNTEAPGMGTTDIEELVTRPLERALLGTPDAVTIRSLSIPGLSVVTLMFEQEIDIYRARQLVTERLQLARSHLPRTAREPQLEPISAPIGALLKFSITSSAADQKQSQRDMRAFGEWTLKPRLLSIPGVTQVIVHGGEVERIEVRPDPVRMRDRGVTLSDFFSAVEESQAWTGAGFVEPGHARLDVRIEARLDLTDAAETLAGLVVTTKNGLPVRLEDVADVVHADEPRFGAAFYDGRAAVYIQVMKLPWMDTRTMTRRVEIALKELERDLPRGMTIEPPVFRQASFIETSIRSVGRAMAIGGVLVIGILVLFLRNARLALISCAAIPLSILAAVALLVATGTTINGMTLGGLAISVGVVVDDAIVDVENVWRRLRENVRLGFPAPPYDVIRDAAREVRGSIVYATIIIGLVLVPVLLLGGMAGRIFSPLALSYIFAIGASLLVALTVTPAMCAWLLPRLATAESRPTPFSLFLLAHYRRILVRAVEHPRTVFVTSGVAALAAAIAMPFLSGRFLPDFRERTLIAHVNAVPGTSLDETMRLAASVDREVRPDPVDHVVARAGRAELGEDPFPVNRLEIDFLLAKGGGGEASVRELAERMARVPGLAFVIEGFLGERVHEILAGEVAPVVVKVLGPELDPLRALAGNVQRIMQETPGLSAIRVEPQIDVPQLRIRPNPTALGRYGIRPLALADEVVAWRQGRPVTEILGREGRITDVVIAGPPAFRDLPSLADLPIAVRAGVFVNLSELATIDAVPAPAAVNHDEGERRITIGAEASGGGLSRAVSRLERRLAALRLPEGYRLSIAGEAVARREAAGQLLLTGALILLGIFALQAVAFSSLSDSAIVLLNFPLGLIGGVAGALVTPEGLSVAGFVGFVTLFGIIARNGILLVAHKKQLDSEQKEEEDPVGRILRAAEERLLPILMTAAAAGLGLLPLALSVEAAGSELEAPMALIVCGGLVTSTALNMLVLPTVYVWLERRRKQGAVT